MVQKYVINYNDPSTACVICGSPTYYAGKNTGFKCTNRKCPGVPVMKTFFGWIVNRGKKKSK